MNPWAAALWRWAHGRKQTLDHDDRQGPPPLVPFSLDVHGKQAGRAADELAALNEVGKRILERVAQIRASIPRVPATGPVVRHTRGGTRPAQRPSWRPAGRTVRYALVGAMVILGWKLWHTLPTVRHWMGLQGGTEDSRRMEFQRFRAAHRVVFDGRDSIIVLGATGKERRNYFVQKGGQYRLDYGRGSTSSMRTALYPVYVNVDRNWFKIADGNGQVTVPLRVRGDYSMNIITHWQNITFDEREDDVEFAFMKDDVDRFRTNETDTMQVPRHVWEAIMQGGRIACCWPRPRSPW